MFKLINGWTKQTVMEAIRTGNNGSRAIATNGVCEYKTDDGNKCFVGCFIPEGHPSCELSGEADRLLEKYPELAEIMPFEKDGLIAFQDTHDDWSWHLGITLHDHALAFLDRFVIEV